jgi:intermediate peptidase
MLMRLARGKPAPWICLRCLRQATRPRPRPRRLNSTFAAAAAASSPPPAALYGLSASGKTDDDALRRVFDNATFWEGFRRSAQKKTPSGIIGNKYLTHPEGFVDFVTITNAAMPSYRRSNRPSQSKTSKTWSGNWTS